MPRASFLAALFGIASVVGTACGGATTAATGDAGPSDTARNPEDAASSDTGREAGDSFPCSTGAVTFQMRVAAPSVVSYCAGTACSRWWLAIETERGDAVALYLECTLNCVDCRSSGCTPPICLFPPPMKPGGEELIWDGTVWVQSTCGARQSCAAPACAPPGKYVARMCAITNATPDAGACTPAPTPGPTCVEVEFEYPTTAPVTGVLP